MPFASEAQRRKFYAMAERGEISKNKVAEYEKETKKNLPERVEAKRKARKYTESKAKKSDA
jgi:hypothetical protein